MHHRLHVITGECQLISEEERPHERELLEFRQCDGIPQQLPFTLKREKLVDELLRVGQEVVVVVLVPRNCNPGLENFYQYQFKDSNETTVYKTCAASWSENEFH